MNRSRGWPKRTLRSPCKWDWRLRLRPGRMRTRQTGAEAAFRWGPGRAPAWLLFRTHRRPILVEGFLQPVLGVVGVIDINRATRIVDQRAARIVSIGRSAAPIV